MNKSKNPSGPSNIWICILVVFLVVGMLSISMLAQNADEMSSHNAVLHVIEPDTISTLLGQFVGKPVILNVWATWCKPCVEELPVLLQIRSDYSSDSVALILISADNQKILETHVRPFLQNLGITFDSYLMKSGSDQKFIEEIDPNWTGAIPHTLFFDRVGNLSAVFHEKQTYSIFERALKKIL